MDRDTQPRDSERRTATVLFADVSGFTAMSEKMDPEEVTALMNGCFAALEEAVDTHGGTVDKYIGDCIMALWGVPQAVEDAPQRAINAAIEMRNRVTDFSRDHKVPLDLHVGINTGLVVAGEVGGARKRDFTVMGDTVNLASRLKDIAKTGAIYVGPQTYRYTRETFEFRTLQPVKVKGKKERVGVYEVLSVIERRHRAKMATAPGMVSSPMVGRDQELQQLRESIARLVGGRGGIVNVIGEAGLGKSRLLAEALGLQDAKLITVLEARSVSIGQNLSYHPFVDLLRHWAGIRETDTDQQAMAGLERAAAATFADDAGEFFPFLATLMGMRLTGAHAQRIAGIGNEAMETWILRSMRALLQKLAARAPVLLLFEDLYWADRSSLNLLESLLRLVADTRVLFVHAFRPHTSDAVERIVEVSRHAHADRCLDIRLCPLDGKQCDQLIRNLLKIEDLPHATRDLIAKKAEGNPFFMEEVVRALIDEGAVEEREGKLRVTAKIDSVVIPGTVQEVIMARIDRMDAATRSLLQVSSVIGRRFRLRVLASVLDEADGLEDRLAALGERQLLLLETARALVREEIEYVFQHALVQETIYESILQRTRRELHAKVAAAIERIYADRVSDFYGMLAYHYSRADIVEKAEEYLFKAGDEAAKSAASREALEFFRDASRLYFRMHGKGGDPGKKVVLERNIGMALLNTGNLIDCIPHFTNALELLGERVPKTAAAVYRQFAGDMLVLLAHLYLPGARRRRSRRAEHMRAALAIMYSKARAQTTSDPQRFFFDTMHTIRRLSGADPSIVEDACSMYAGSAALFCYSGISFAIARRLLAEAREYIRDGNAPDVFTHGSMVFLLNYFEGNWNEPSGIDDDLVRQALRFVRPWEVYTYLDLRCEEQIYRGAFAAAGGLLAQVAEGSSVYGYDFAESSRQGLTAIMLLQQRRLPEALAAVETYVESRNEQLLNLRGLGNRAKIELLCGDRDAARATLQRAERLMHRAGTVPPFHLSAYLMSRALFDVIGLAARVAAGRTRRQLSARRARARKSVRAAVGIAAKMARERTEAYTLAGRLHWLLGDRDRALRHFAAAIAEGERLGAWPDVGRTYLEVAMHLSNGGPRHGALNGFDAAAYRTKARETFSTLGLVWDLTQLERWERAGS